MLRSETELDPAAEVDDVLVALRRSLRRLLLSSRDRRAVMDEVGADLRAAAADGVSPWELVGPDVDDFARAAVETGKYRPRTGAYGRTLVGGLLGAAVALVAGYVLVMVVIFPRVTALASFEDPDVFYPVLGAYVAFGGIALVVTIGAVLALPLALWRRPAVGATCARAGLLVLLAAAASVALAVTSGSGDVGPSDGLVAAVAVAIAALISVALLLGRWWALRAATRKNSREGSSSTW